jgi:hypothetical protein
MDPLEDLDKFIAEGLTFQLNPPANTEQECPICTEPFDADPTELIAVTRTCIRPHTFHTKCLLHWVRVSGKSTCPSCRNHFFYSMEDRRRMLEDRVLLQIELNELREEMRRQRWEEAHRLEEAAQALMQAMADDLERPVADLSEREASQEVERWIRVIPSMESSLQLRERLRRRSAQEVRHGDAELAEQELLRLQRDRAWVRLARQRLRLLLRSREQPLTIPTELHPSFF